MIDQQAGTPSGDDRRDVHGHEGDARARHRVPRGHRAARVPRSRRHSRDEVQGDAVRMLYIHVPVGVGRLPRLRRHRARAACSTSGSAPARSRGTASPAPRPRSACSSPGSPWSTGMIWGHLAWGVYWTWDARLTTTALLFVLFLGYLALRRMPAEPRGSERSAVRHPRDHRVHRRADRPPVGRVVAHAAPGRDGLRRDLQVQIEGIMLFTLFLGFVVFTLVYVWLLLHRARIAVMEDALDEHGLELALDERRAEGRAGSERLRAGSSAPTSSSSAASRSTRSGLVHARPVARRAAARRGQAVDLTPAHGPGGPDAAGRLRAAAAGAVVEAAQVGVSVVLACCSPRWRSSSSRACSNATMYFYNADEAVAKKTSLEDKRFRLQGTVVPGTVRDTGETVDFDVTFNGVTVAGARPGRAGRALPGGHPRRARRRSGQRRRLRQRPHPREAHRPSTRRPNPDRVPANAP